MKIINKVCKHCKTGFLASCGKEEFCSDKCKILSNSVTNENGCHMWQRTKDKDGYGYVKLKGGKTSKVHRAAYKLFKGEIDDSLMVCHSCDTPSCCNPEHLFLGSAADNKGDCVAKRRDMNSRGEKHYKAKLTESNVLEILASKDIAPRLAEKFGVHRNMIYEIRKGNNWKHLQNTCVSVTH